MCYKIAQWCGMTTEPVPRIRDNNIGEILYGAVDDQQTIGWNNFMKGRLSINWKMAQAMYINDLPKNRTAQKFDCKLWSSKVIMGIWSTFCLVWNVCNAHLHMEMQVELISSINQQVRKSFSLKHSVFETDQSLFLMTLYDRMNCSDESKALWLQSVHIAVHDFTIVHKLTPQQQVMTDFFQCRRQSEDGDSSQGNGNMTGQGNVVGDTEYIPVLI
eukprot:15349062-Ditylum_brightwellii.AAC.2